jgi:hypothetical protein
MTRPIGKKKKSEGEGKKEAKKRIGREKVLLTGVIQTPPWRGLGLRMRNASPCIQDSTIGMIQW